ncbi:MAG TPA: RHS repeat-associated core domain-containing protein, partial [Brumimicrobium sp.]|nr:RHS repeat-associated core domain-containing protein [Brumimicrobium sp.]
LYGGLHGSTGTFRMDDFILNGYTQEENTGNGSGNGYVVMGGYRYGFNSMEKDDEIKGQGNSYNFGARMYDPRVGRWLSLDPLSREYPEYSDYSFVGNSPILFIDKDGRVIGNPNSPDAQRLKAALVKTEAGKVLWEQMEASKRVIFIYIGTAEETAGEVRNNINNHLRSSSADGELVSELMFKKISSGEDLSNSDYEDSYEFDSETGEFNKTTAFDKSYILISEMSLLITAELYDFVDDEQKKHDLAIIKIGGEEAAHSVQDYADMVNAEVDSETGKYLNPNEDSSTVKPYNERRHEVEAKEKASEIEKEYQGL